LGREPEQGCVVAVPAEEMHPDRKPASFHHKGTDTAGLAVRFATTPAHRTLSPLTFIDCQGSSGVDRIGLSGGGGVDIVGLRIRSTVMKASTDERG
jgi:hypothetical protein